MSNSQSELEKRNVSRLSNAKANQLTKECLQTALLHLMEKKPLEQITITELVAHAGVSRASFYRNYLSKEDILREINTEYFSAVSESFHTTYYDDSPYQWYYNIFSYVAEHADVFKLLLKADLPEMISFFNHPIMEKIDPSKAADGHFLLLAQESVVKALLTDWFHRGMKESIEHMATLCENYINQLGSA